MPVFPNLRRVVPRSELEGEAPPTPRTYVDTPTMDYRAWLDASGRALATLPGDPSRFRVAVVGSGGGGLAAAYELLRCGVDVTVFEATDRVGGRLFTLPASTGDGNVFEMGAMRFTPSEHVLHHYADVFNNSGASSVVFDTGAFPDPGVNLTYVAFQGCTYVWDPAAANPYATLPPSAQRVNAGWNALMRDGFTSRDGTIRLEAPNAITTWLSKDPAETAECVREAWGAYLAAFGNASLYEAVVRIFTDPNAPGGEGWSPEDFEFFGALGTGFGGFGPLFPIGFTDILRFVINAVDAEHHELVTGVDSIVRGFLEQPVTRADGSIDTLSRHVATRSPVVGIATEADGGVRLTFAGGRTERFDRVVVAASHRSMELTMGLGVSRGGRPLAEPVADAVRRLHLENSSKVFVETSDFWNRREPGTRRTWPRNVVGDTVLRNLYTLTYPCAPANTGALLFSYTWADDSVKQQAVTDPQARLDLLVRDLASVSAPLADAVAGSMKRETARVIDWQSQPYFFGAFKLNLPGQDTYVDALFRDFLKAGTAEDTGVYLAGDSIGFLGGWVENAFQTGLNAAAAVAVSLGGTLTAPEQSPFTQLRTRRYDYSPVPTPAPAPAPLPVLAPVRVAVHALVGDAALVTPE